MNDEQTWLAYQNSKASCIRNMRGLMILELWIHDGVC